jgi:hypothetical protein
MFRNFVNGLFVGTGILFTAHLLAYILPSIGVDQMLKNLVISPNNQPTTLGTWLWLIIIVLSLMFATLYRIKCRSDLKSTNQRRFSQRILLLLVTATVFLSLKSTIPPVAHFDFLWTINLLMPDTIGYLYGYPINLWTIICLILYSWYTIALSMKRKSIDVYLHLGATLSFIIFSYNIGAGFFLFWSIQSISLLLLTKKLARINEPRN